MCMIFKIKDFVFEPFTDDGDSGQLYIATRKSDNKKFIVKQEFSDCACNEFMYFSVARAIGLETLVFHLFEFDPSECQFASGYAIAIEFIDTIEFEGIVKQRDKIANWQDYFKHFALYSAFMECDSFEILLDKSMNIYRIDTTDAFILHPMFIDTFANPTAHNYFYKLALQKDQQIYDSLVRNGNSIKEKYGLEKYHVFRTAVSDLSKLSKEVIDSILCNLCLVYMKEIKQYYLNFFRSCQEACCKYCSEFL